MNPRDYHYIMEEVEMSYEYKIKVEERPSLKTPVQIEIREQLGGSVLLSIKKGPKGPSAFLLTITPEGDINLFKGTKGSGLAAVMHIEDYFREI